MEQNRNRRSNRMLTFNGETLCATEWATRTGISPELLHWRLGAGWTMERALSTTPQPYRKSEPSLPGESP